MLIDFHHPKTKSEMKPPLKNTKTIFFHLKPRFFSYTVFIDLHNVNHCLIKEDYSKCADFQVFNDRFFSEQCSKYEFIDLLCVKNYWGQRKNFFYSACISEDFSDNWIFIVQYSKWQLNEVCEKSCKYILRC